MEETPQAIVRLVPDASGSKSNVMPKPASRFPPTMRWSWTYSCRVQVRRRVSKTLPTACLGTFARGGQATPVELLRRREGGAKHEPTS